MINKTKETICTIIEEKRYYKSVIITRRISELYIFDYLLTFDSNSPPSYFPI